jgi:hypothetical protein
MRGIDFVRALCTDILGLLDKGYMERIINDLKNRYMKNKLMLSGLMLLIMGFVIVSGCVGETSKSKITGSVSDTQNKYSVISGVLIRAIPADGSAPVNAVSDDNGYYSMDVKPGIRYDLKGMFYDPYGQYTFIDFYRNNSACDYVTLAPGETVTLNTQVLMLHPPKSFSWTIDPVTGYFNDSYSPPVPVSISGHVYLDGKPVSGANVEAVSVYGRNRTSNVTDDEGAYVLGLYTKEQYNVTATYQGLRHTVWPVHLWNGQTGVYDINLTRTPTSTITGVSELQRPGTVTIEAVPVNGDKTFTAVTGNDASYSLDVEPLVYYNISGKFRESNGNYHNVTFAYRTGIFCSGFMVRSNETALIDCSIPELFT